MEYAEHPGIGNAPVSSLVQEPLDLPDAVVGHDLGQEESRSDELGFLSRSFHKMAAQPSGLMTE